MIININKAPVIVKTNPFFIDVDVYLKDSIKRYFEEYSKLNKGVYDGDILTVSDYSFDTNTITISKGKYSWYIFSKNEINLGIHCLFVSVLFKTLDNRYVLIKNNQGNIDIIGGIVEETDLENDDFNPDSCLARELIEELAIDLFDKKMVQSFQMKYLNYPKTNNGSYGVIYTGLLNVTSDNLLKYYEASKEKNLLDGEIVEVLPFTKDDIKALDLPSGNASYFKEIMKFED